MSAAACDSASVAEQHSADADTLNLSCDAMSVERTEKDQKRCYIPSCIRVYITRGCRCCCIMDKVREHGPRGG